jgi:hypothetical protein
MYGSGQPYTCAHNACDKAGASFEQTVRQDMCCRGGREAEHGGVGNWCREESAMSKVQEESDGKLVQEESAIGWWYWAG